VNESVRVSIVVAVDDAPTHLLEAVTSALASGLQELEVIVVDNGPQQHSAAVIGNEGDPRLVRVSLRPGQGTARPRNVGIARARAPYVAFLDPDDLLKPDGLSAAVSALERHSDAGFAFMNFECIDKGGNAIQPSGMARFPRFRSVASEPLEDRWRLIRQPHLARGLLDESFIGTSGAVVRRKLFSEIGPFAEEAACCTDLDLWFRLAHRCHALYCDEIGRSHRESGTGDADRSRAATEECNAVLRRERERWSERTARRVLDRRIAENLAQVASLERQRRHRLRSSAMFAYAFATSPDVRWLRGMLRSIVG
jgi:glycosyltransferase involved in cell wall biosynthesis